MSGAAVVRRHELYNLETRRTQVLSEPFALELIDSDDSRGYEQPPVPDNVPRHLVVHLVMPKSVLHLGMRLTGSLERGQSTSARMMRTVEHFISLVCKYCNLRADAACDRRADSLLCDSFYWTRADTGSLYLYECHCVSLVALSEEVQTRFNALLNAMCVKFNWRWPLSRKQFPLAILNRSFVGNSGPVHFARGREPLVRDTPQLGFALRYPVTQHHNVEQPPSLDRVYFRDFFHSPMLVSFPQALPSNLSVADWALRVLQPEQDLEYRVLVPRGDASKSDVQQLLDARVTLTHEQQQRISKLFDLQIAPHADCKETSFFLLYFKIPAPAAAVSATAAAASSVASQSQSLRVPAPKQASQQAQPPRSPSSSSGRSRPSSSPRSPNSSNKRARQTINIDPPREMVHDSDTGSSVEEIQEPIDVGFEPMNRAERAFARQIEQYEIERRQREPRSILRRSIADAQSRSAQAAQQLEEKGVPNVRPSVRFTTGTQDAGAQASGGFV